MVLRKCPACKDMVTAESEWCPRCGVKIRSVWVRRVVGWVVVGCAGVWGLAHFMLHHHLR